MKWLLTEKNILYDNSYSNIPYLIDENTRDQYINDYLVSDYKNKLEARPNIKQQILDVIDNVIEIAVTREELGNKNYIIIKNNLGEISYHFINSYENGGTNNSFILTIEKDLNMTFPTIWENIRNTFAEQTHINNYYGYEMDGGYKEILGLTDFPYKDTDNEVYNQLKNKGWLVVFERVNDEDDYLPKINNGNIYKEPFKIYVAPMTSIPVSEGEKNETILYYQENPIKYIYGNSKNNSTETDITLGLSTEIDYNNDVIFYITTDGINNNNNIPNTIFIKKEWLPLLDNQEKLMVLPLQNVFNSLSVEINNKIINNEIWEDLLVMNTGNDGLGDRGNYLPVKITKINDTTIKIRTTQIKEWINLIPNAYAYIARNQFYYKDKDPETWGLIPHYYDMKISFNKISQLEYNTWSNDSLFNYLENPENANIITAKTTNFIPIETSQTEGIFSILSSNNIIYEEDKKIYRINALNYDNLLKINSYSLDVSDLNKYDLISGLNKYALVIENNKEFDLNPNFITNDKKINFQHYASFTPDWEERIKYIDGNYFNLTTEDNAFINNKEFIKGNDLLGQYKVNNPVRSKADWLRPFFGIGNIASLFLGKGKTTRKVGKTITREVLGRSGTKWVDGQGPRGGGGVNQPKYRKRTLKETTTFNYDGKDSHLVNSILRSLPMIGSIASVPLERANMKNAPDQFQGNGDINGDLIFNYNGIKFSLITYEFITPRRDAIIRDLKMTGASDNIFLENLFKYRQKSFNFYKLNDLDFSNSQTLRNFLKPEEYDKVNDIVTNGFTLWYNPETFLDWESNDSSV